jgi:hypothetical protein
VEVKKQGNNEARSTFPIGHLLEKSTTKLQEGIIIEFPLASNMLIVFSSFFINFSFYLYER